MSPSLSLNISIGDPSRMCVCRTTTKSSKNKETCTERKEKKNQKTKAKTEQKQTSTNRIAFATIAHSMHIDTCVFHLNLCTKNYQKRRALFSSMNGMVHSMFISSTQTQTHTHTQKQQPKLSLHAMAHTFSLPNVCACSKLRSTLSSLWL